MSEERNYTIEDLATPEGKGLAIFKIANTSLYRVAFKTGGQVPKDLHGAWTDPVSAQKAIKRYLAGIKLKAKEVEVEAISSEVFDVPKNKVAPAPKKKAPAKGTK